MSVVKVDHSRRVTVGQLVNHKKRDILFLTITLANLNRFLQFLYQFNREEILHVTIIFITSPDLCAHLTWKNQTYIFAVFPKTLQCTCDCKSVKS